MEKYEILLEEKQVIVVGPIDAQILLNEVAKYGKSVALLPNNRSTARNKRHFKNSNEMVHPDDHKHREPHEQHSSSETSSKEKTDRHHHSHQCPHEQSSSSRNPPKEEHVHEPGAPVRFGACKDDLCATHLRGFKITNTVPMETYNLFGNGIWHNNPDAGDPAWRLPPPPYLANVYDNYPPPHQPPPYCDPFYGNPPMLGNYPQYRH